jgi:hypothetical protein
MKRKKADLNVREAIEGCLSVEVQPAQKASGDRIIEIAV